MNNSTKNNQRVFVALSGGVDSSVAAALLKEQGYNVTGVFMKNWSDPAWPCPFKEDRQDAMRVCAKLEIPFKIFDFTKEYKSKVVDYMIAEYAKGRTPNPDVMCNKEIKFGLFFSKAMAMGADFIATGHYVRKIKSQKSKVKNCALARARYLNKDQSYFLWTLKQKQLAKCLFPIGEIESKAKVREIAAGFGLPTASKKDSQGICFMGPIDIEEFIKPYIKLAHRGMAGDIITVSGEKIGTHHGLDFYTIGQRKGIGVGGTGPYYVARKDYALNILVVAPITDQSALELQSLVANNVGFVGEEINSPIKIKAAIRYRQEPEPAVLSKISDGCWKIEFKNPVRAITEGQSVVFYRGEEMLGGGIIESAA